MAEDGGGEGDGFAAEAETGFDELFPGVDVVLVLAGEELAHFEVDAVDVGGQGEDGEEKDEARRRRRWRSLAASFFLRGLEWLVVRDGSL